MTHIHITCAAADAPLAETIAADLRQREAQVSVSKLSAEKFAPNSGKTIAGCDALVLLYSPRALQSAWVQAEVAWALQAEKLIIPIMLEPTSRVDFFFLIGLAEVSLAGQSFDKALYTLATLLHLETQTQAQTQTAPAPLANPSAEPSLENVFDEKDAEGLFFAAAEIVSKYPERAVFLYRFVLRLAPDYAGGSARTFVERETARLKPDLLLALSQETDSAISKQEWQRVQHLVHDIKAIAGESPLVDRIKARIAAARLSTFHIEISAALVAEKWDEIGQIIAKVEASGIDEEIVEGFKTSTRKTQLERMVENAYQALGKKEWAVAQEYSERIQALVPDSPHPKTIAEKIKQGRIASWVIDAHLALDSGNWQQAEVIRNAIVNLDPNSNEVKQITNRIKSWRASALVTKAQPLVTANDLPELQNTIDELRAIDPLNPALVSLQDQANELRKRAAQYTECDAIYQQAIHAQAAGRTGAVLTFMRHIRDTCPDYGDPQGLIGDEIVPETASLVREVNMLTLTKDAVSGVAFSPDGTLLATANNSGGGTVWNIRENKPHTTISSVTRSVLFSPDSRILAAAGSTNHVNLWDVIGFSIGYLTGKPNTTIQGISFSPGGSALAAACSDGKIRLFSVEERKQIATLSGHSPYIAYSVAFSPDGALVASGGHDGVLRVYEAPDLRKSKAEALSWLPRLMPAEEIPAAYVEVLNIPVHSVAFAPQGGLLAAGTSAGSIHLIDTTSEPYRVLDGIQVNNGVVNSLAFSLDGSLLVAAFSYFNILIWDIRGDKPQLLNTLKGHTGSVNSIAFSADSRFIASSSVDRTVRLWGLHKLFDDKPKR